MAEAKIKILVVDDDLRLRDLLNRYLTEQGFVVRAVADAATAELFQQAGPLWQSYAGLRRYWDKKGEAAAA